MSSGITATVRAPTLHSVYATPGTVLEDLDLMVWRMLLQELRIDRQLCQLVRFNLLQRIRKSHLPKMVMVPIALAISGDVHDLLPVTVCRKTAHEAFRKHHSVIQQPFKGHRPRNGSV